jgi:organic hydroperoxide reductase OsmC/OhrA
VSEEGRFTIQLEHLQDYEFKVRFDWDQVGDVLMDEPPPLGRRAGPNASRMLAAAAANCLSASLLFCLHKEAPPPGGLRTRATCRIVRNEQKRLRIGGLEVQLQVGPELEQAVRLRRCLDLFEDFCVVTASIRQGIPVRVEVVTEAGEVLHSAE